MQNFGHNYIWFFAPKYEGTYEYNKTNWLISNVFHKQGNQLIVYNSYLLFRMEIMAQEDAKCPIHKNWLYQEPN